MEQVLADMFEQARKLVSEADRKLAEEEERRRDKEREAKLIELAGLVESAFDFTSKEKMELDPRLDLQNSQLLVEFVVRSLRAIFVLSSKTEELWSLSVLEDGREPQSLGDLKGGDKGDAASRRLAAARVVTAIGDWAQKLQPVLKKPAPVTARWEERPQAPPAPVERREPTYGTFGKFLGY